MSEPTEGDLLVQTILGPCENNEVKISGTYTCDTGLQTEPMHVGRKVCRVSISVSKINVQVELWA